MNPQQRKHLQGRLELARRNHSNRQDLPVPAAVAKAHKVIEAYEKAKWAKYDARRKRVEEASARVAEAILFGDPTRALDALKKFESAKF